MSSGCGTHTERWVPSKIFSCLFWICRNWDGGHCVSESQRLRMGPNPKWEYGTRSQYLILCNAATNAFGVSGIKHAVSLKNKTEFLRQSYKASE